MKKLFTRKRVFITVGILLALLTLLILLLHSGWVRSGIINMARRKLLEENLHLSVGSLQYNLFTPEFILKDISLRSSAGTHQKAFFYAKSITLKAPYSSLWKEEREIKFLEIVQPELHIRINKDGTSNIPDFTKTTESDDAPTDKDPGVPGRSYLVHLFRISKFKLSYENMGSGLKAMIPNISLLLKILPETHGSHLLRIESKEQGYVQLKSQRIPIKQLFLESNLNHKEFNITNSLVEAKGTSLTMTAGIKNYLTDLLINDLKVKGSLDLDQIRKFAHKIMGTSIHDSLENPWVKKLKGTLALNVHMQGTVEDPRISCTLKSSGSKENKHNPISLTGSLEWHNKKLSVNHFSFNWRGNGQITAKGELYPVIPGNANKLHLTLKKINLQLLHPFIDLKELDPHGQLLQSRVMGSIHLRAKDFSLKGLEGNGHLQIEPVIKKKSISGQLQAFFKAGRIRANLKEFHIPGVVKAKGNIQWPLSGETGNFYLESPLIKNEHLLKDNFKVKGSIRGKGDGIFITVNPLNPILRHIRLETEIQPLAPYSVKGRLQVKNVKIENMQQLLLINNSPFALQIDADATFGFDLQKPLETLHIKTTIGTATLGNKSFQVQNDGPLIIHYDPRTVHVRQMKFKNRDGSMNFFLSGRYPLKTTSPSSLTIKGAVDFDRFTGYKQLLEDMDLAGIFSIEANIGGSPDKPELYSRMQLTDASVATPVLPDKITDLSFQMTIANKKVSIKHLGFTFLGDTFSMPKPAHITLNNRNGLVNINGFTINSPNAALNITGTSGNGNNLDFSVSGNLDNKLVNNFVPSIYLAGTSLLNLHLGGTAEKPDIKGTLTLKDNRVEMKDPDIFLSQLNGKILLSGDSIKLDNINGDLNGGKAIITGQYDLKNTGESQRGANTKFAPMQQHISLIFENAKFHYPLGLQSELSGSLVFKPRINGLPFLVTGQLNLIRGSFKDLPESQLQNYLDLHPPAIETEIFESEKSLLDQIGLDIRFKTDAPLWVDNSICRAEVIADLRVKGSAANPGVIGRGSVNSGGQVFFNNRTFTIETGVVSFNDPNAIDPYVLLKTGTIIAGYDILLNIQGFLHSLSPQLSSQPELPVADIVSLLVSGRLVQDGGKDQKIDLQQKTLSLASYLTTAFAQQKVKEISGLDNIRIDTGLDDKSAGITISEHLAKNLELVLAQSLKDTNKRAFTLRYEPFKQLGLEARKRMDNQYGFNFNHQIFFNPHKKKENNIKKTSTAAVNSKKRNSKKAPIVAKIIYTPLPGVRADGIGEFRTNLMKQKTGKRFNYYRFSQGLEAIKRFYRKKGFLSMEIRPHRQEKNGKISFTIHITPGPRVSIVYPHGFRVPRKLKRKIRDTLSLGNVNERSLIDATLALRIYLYKKKYYQANVTFRKHEPKPGNQLISFLIDRGKKYKELKPGRSPSNLIFSGNRAISTDRLGKIFKKRGMSAAVFAYPKHVQATIKRLYLEKGYLDARVRSQPPLFEGNSVSVIFKINEGPKFRVNEIRLKGNRYLSRKKIEPVIGFKKDETFSVIQYRRAETRLKELYTQQGFTQSVITSRVQRSRSVDSAKSGVVVTFDIKENQQAIIRDIRITGNQLTDKKIILQALAFKKGDTIYYKTVNKSRNNLYTMGIFQQVDITPVPIGKVSELKPQPYRVDITLKERKRFRLKYGFTLNSTLKPGTEISYGVTTQFSDYNLFGRGSHFDVITGIGDREQRIKTTLAFPDLFGKKVNRLLSLQYKRTLDPIELESADLGVSQKYKFGNFSLLSFDYHISLNKQNRRVGVFEGGTADNIYKYRVGALSTAFRWDNRNNIMDADSGSYHNYSLSYGHKLLGSQVKYIRFSGHYSLYRQWGPLVYAGAIRAGLIKDYGIALPYGERFFAGGGTTIRGFGENQVGPLDQDNLPLGGNALFLMNNELRLRIWPVLGTVLFMDMGNAFAGISDFDPGNLRKSIGFGVRLYTPMGLFRVDMGFKLNRRPDESAYALFFSFGQAF